MGTKMAEPQHVSSGGDGEHRQNANKASPRPNNTYRWAEDPVNPHNWPVARKYIVTILLSAFSFSTLMSSTIITPALPQIRKDFNTSTDSKTQLALSIYVLAYAVGYLFWAPLSEVYGRKKILLIANLWFCIWNMICGFAENEATMTVGRLLSGAGAAAALALGAGTIGEIWQPQQRGRSLAALSTISLLGPCVGPIIGGVVAGHSVNSWRWAFWSTTIFNAAVQVMSLRFYHESHVPTISRRQQRQQNQKEFTDATAASHIITNVLVTAMKRPFYLVFTQPASAGLILYSGINFGALYMVLATIPTAFMKIYNQSATVASFNYLSYGIGTTIGAQLCAPISDYLYRRNAQNYRQRATTPDEERIEVKNFAVRPPTELRLYPLIPTVLLTGFGFLILGWGLRFQKHWFVPNFGIALFGLGSQAMTQCTNAYIIDTFSEIKLQAPVAGAAEAMHRNTKEDVGITTADALCQDHEQTSISINWTASAMTSIWSSKSLGGFIFPLFAFNMINAWGWGWSFSLLALINLCIGMPVAIVLLIYGAKLRETGRRRIEQDMMLGKI